MIGKEILELLAANTDLTDLVPAAKMFPYVIEKDTALPAIVYTIETITPQYTKDGWHKDDSMFNVVSFNFNYEDLQEIAYQVRQACEWKFIESGNTIRHIRMTGQDEGFNITENVYVNRLTFSANITNYKNE